MLTYLLYKLFKNKTIVVNCNLNSRESIQLPANY